MSRTQLGHRSEAAILQRIDAADRRGMHAAQRREERFEDVRDMISWGVHPDQIATRVGTTVDALVRQAYRWDADDIGRYMQRVEVAA